MSILAGIGSAVKIASGLSGLFGKKKKAPTVQENMMAQAQGARMAAEAFGFNPLTMLQFGNPQGTGLANSSAPPLASTDLLVDGLAGVDDIVSGDLRRRRAADQLNLDMAALKLDQARSGVLSVPIGAVNTVAKGPSPLGQRPIQVQQSNGASAAPLSMSGSLKDRGHSIEAPVKQGLVDMPDPKLDTGTGIYANGAFIQSTPGWSPVSVLEEEYGDLISLPYGILKAGADIGYNLRSRRDNAEMERLSRESMEDHSKRPKPRDFYTHPQTGFSAPRRRFGM